MEITSIGLKFIWIITIDKKAAFADIICGVPLKLIVRLLLILIYVTSLSNTSNLFDSGIFADNIDLLYFSPNLRTLFNTINKELNKIFEQSKAEKLFWIVKKSKFTVFDKNSMTDVPLQLPKLKVPSNKVKR